MDTRTYEQYKNSPALPSSYSPDWQYMENFINDIYNDSEIKALLNFPDKPNKCEISNWKEFGLEQLFDCVLSKGDNQAKKLEDGKIPLVSAGMFQNGICKHIKNGDGKSEIFKSPCLTVDMFGKTFYQSENFYAVSHGRVNILIPKFELTKNIGLFFSSILDSQFLGKFSFTKMCSQSQIQTSRVLLPATADGTPDWQFMEDYIKSLPCSGYL